MEASETELYAAPEGLPGLSGRTFVLVAPGGLDAPCWLQSTEEPSQALLLVDPKRLDASYDPSPGSIGTLLGAERDALILRAVAWPCPEEGKLYANLFAPVWLSPTERKLAQVLMVGSGHAVRAGFPLPPAR